MHVIPSYSEVPKSRLLEMWRSEIDDYKRVILVQSSFQERASKKGLPKMLLDAASIRFDRKWVPRFTSALLFSLFVYPAVVAVVGFGGVAAATGYVAAAAWTGLTSFSGYKGVKEYQSNKVKALRLEVLEADSDRLSGETRTAVKNELSTNHNVLESDFDADPDKPIFAALAIAEELCGRMGKDHGNITVAAMEATYQTIAMEPEGVQPEQAPSENTKPQRIREAGDAGGLGIGRHYLS